MSMRWKTGGKGLVPEGLDAASFERWLWRLGGLGRGGFGQDWMCDWPWEVREGEGWMIVVGVGGLCWTLT